MGVSGAGGDYAAICPLMPVGEGTSTPHLTWSDAPLPDSGLAIIEIAGVRRRYHAALTRTVHFGKPPAAYLDMARTIVEAVDAGLEMARSGNTCEQVEASWQVVLRKNGLKKESRVGYPVGLAYPPDWTGGNSVTGLRHDSELEIETGMSFHILSWLMGTGRGDDFISNAVLLTDDGTEVLTRTPTGPIVR